MLDQMVGGDQDPPLPSQKTVSEGLCPGGAGPQLAVPELQRLAVMQRPGHIDLGAPGTEAAGHRRRARDHLLGDPVADISAAAFLVVALGVLAEVLDEAARRSIAATSAPERVGHDVDQPEVVDVLVGDDDQLEVLDPCPSASSCCSSSSSALPELGPESIRVSGSSSSR